MSATAVTFELLQARFVERLDRRLAGLRGSLDALRGPSGIDDERAVGALDDLTRGFHSLVGTGGTYGFTELAETAAIGDLLCRAIQVPVNAEDLSMLDFVIDSLAGDASSAAAR